MELVGRRIVYFGLQFLRDWIHAGGEDTTKTSGKQSVAARTEVG